MENTTITAAINPNGITPQKLAQEVSRLAVQASESKGILKVKSTNQWLEEAKNKPIPRMLFDQFWFEGELSILFADTNLGKSILAVQIANSITKGIPIKGFKMEADNQAVIYADFELSSKQIENRYSDNYSNHYVFDESFFRIELDTDAEIPEDKTFEEYLYESLELAIIDTESKILIVDNITYLRNETEKARDALPLMKLLKNLKSKYDLSILVLAHTPKRDLTKPITRNDLQGSKMLMNFCDSSFAIGESFYDKGTRYLKQIKVRSSEFIYDTENVCVCEVKKDINFLMFEFLNFGREKEHLKQISDKEKNELQESISKLMDENPDISSYAIAKELCPDEKNFNSFKVKVNRICKKIKENINSSNT